MIYPTEKAMAMDAVLLAFHPGGTCYHRQQRSLTSSMGLMPSKLQEARKERLWILVIGSQT